jgi:hypothetical protein
MKNTKKKKKTGLIKFSKDLLFTKNLKDSWVGSYVSLKEMKAKSQQQKKENEKLIGKSFEETIEIKLQPDQTKEEFINNSYRNEYSLFVASALLFIIVSVFNISEFHNLQSWITKSTVILFNIATFLGMYNHSANCYFISKEEFYIHRKFITDFKSWIPKSPKSELLQDIRELFSSIKNSFKSFVMTVKANAKKKKS